MPFAVVAGVFGLMGVVLTGIGWAICKVHEDHNYDRTYEPGCPAYRHAQYAKCQGFHKKDKTIKNKRHIKSL